MATIKSVSKFQQRSIIKILVAENYNPSKIYWSMS